MIPVVEAGRVSSWLTSNVDQAERAVEHGVERRRGRRIALRGVKRPLHRERHVAEIVLDAKHAAPLLHVGVGQTFDFAGQLVTIKYPDGTHSVPIVMSAEYNWVGGGQLRIDGNAATPANCVLSIANTDAITIEGRKSGPVLLRGFKVTTSSAGNAINLGAGAWARLENSFDFSTTGYGHIYLAGNSTLQLVGSYTISGGGSLHYTVDQHSVLAVSGSITITLTGTPAFANQFLRCMENSYAYLAGITFSGAAIGVRYSAHLNAVIQTNAAGANYLPGNAAGVTTNGGQYS